MTHFIAAILWACALGAAVICGYGSRTYSAEQSREALLFGVAALVLGAAAFALQVLA